MKIEPVARVAKAPDYWNRGHFYEGSEHVLEAMADLSKLPLGTELFTHLAGHGEPVVSEREALIASIAKHCVSPDIPVGMARAWAAHAVDEARSSLPPAALREKG